MKISNSKKELARIISENGGWRDGAESAAQCKPDSAVSFYRDIPDRGGDCWCGKHLDGCDIGQDRLIANWHQTILSRVEYFHLYPAPDADGWIAWNGGECPVEAAALIDVKFMGGTTSADGGSASDFYWKHDGDHSDIIAYRLHKPEQVEPQYCESVTRSTPGPTIAPTLDQLLQDWRNSDDYAQRKQTEADEAASMRDERWQAVQDRAGEMGVTVERKI